MLCKAYKEVKEKSGTALEHHITKKKIYSGNVQYHQRWVRTNAKVNDLI